jgi:hypothetical protein
MRRQFSQTPPELTGNFSLHSSHSVRKIDRRNISISHPPSFQMYRQSIQQPAIRRGFLATGFHVSPLQYPRASGFPA